MLTLGTDAKNLNAALDAPGGFAWWYLDVVDDHGNGLVLIWSLGLPFLPGRAAAARRGEAAPARERPSLNVCIYQAGELDFYLLQEYPPEEVSYPDGVHGQWRFGRTEITSQSQGDDHRVAVDLDCRVPGSEDRLTGLIDVRGPTVETGKSLTLAEQKASHHWQILTTATTGKVDLTCAENPYKFTGRTYHDTNNGTRPLHEIGIDYWMWARVPTGMGEKVFYALWPEQHRSGEPPVSFGLEVSPDGEVNLQRELQLETGQPSRTLGGMTWWQQVRLRTATGTWLDLDYPTPVDSGPFYLRSLPRSLGSDGARGVGEFIAPDRIDLARHRPLVNMRVDHLDRRNSMWLPLFSGPRRGRVRRLLTQWW